MRRKPQTQGCIAARGLPIPFCAGRYPARRNFCVGADDFHRPGAHRRPEGLRDDASIVPYKGGGKPPPVRVGQRMAFSRQEIRSALTLFRSRRRILETPSSCIVTP